ncbi:hypothetical protein AAT19DRAFT_11904 [Rhodotorula toruloides]|uniref:Uncharacterized protein n=1 Tax=Rhodotorula toruloides TaxID=5286 RepID=A0A2S9ZVX7_RHOTO|nr:hypothetical protein AAT19DRAFT_11904 [Rhodotorula toruloides]
MRMRERVGAVVSGSGGSSGCRKSSNTTLEPARARMRSGRSQNRARCSLSSSTNLTPLGRVCSLAIDLLLLVSKHSRTVRLTCRRLTPSLALKVQPTSSLLALAQCIVLLLRDAATGLWRNTNTYGVNYREEECSTLGRTCHCQAQYIPPPPPPPPPMLAVSAQLLQLETGLTTESSGFLRLLSSQDRR